MGKKKTKVQVNTQEEVNLSEGASVSPPEPPIVSAARYVDFLKGEVRSLVYNQLQLQSELATNRGFLESTKLKLEKALQDLDRESQ